MRLIDADELSKWISGQSKSPSCPKDESSFGLRIMKYIDRMPSVQPEQRWIPWDSGRLPDDSGTYIVTAYDGVQERVTFAKYQKRLKRWELTGARAYWRVFAWMPLPEPCQEEGGQDETD